MSRNVIYCLQLPPHCSCYNCALVSSQATALCPSVNLRASCQPLFPRPLAAMPPREKDVYFAKLAEQAERYDEMADHMKNVGNADSELSVEERNLLSVAYKNTVGSRRAAWRIITSVMQKETTKGNTENAAYAKEYCKKVEDRFCSAVASFLKLGLRGSWRCLQALGLGFSLSFTI